MKRFAWYIFSLLILLSLVGCAGTNTIKESNEDSAAITDTTIVPNITSTQTPCDFDIDADRIVPNMPQTPTLIDLEVETKPTTTMTPTPTQSNFDVDDVKMQATPQSSCFSEIGYDSDWEVLVVRFRDSGSVYTYSNFPKSEWNKFVSADSLGRWYNKYIKGKYEYEKIY